MANDLWPKVSIFLMFPIEHLVKQFKTDEITQSKWSDKF